MREFKCNGAAYPDSTDRRRSMTEQQVKFMHDTFDARRDAFRQARDDKAGRHGEYHWGHRFNDNDTLLIRILSQTTVDDMIAHPNEWADAAFDDCASADHWYTYEKQWE